MNDEFHDFEDLLRDEHLMDQNEFTHDDVKWALSELMDGVKQHDLPGMTGLSELQCARVFCIAQFAAETRGNFVIGENVCFDGCNGIGQIDRVVDQIVYIRCNGKMYTRKVDKVYR